MSLTEKHFEWWMANNYDEFRSINSKLPGKLKILENDDPIAQKVIAASSNPYYVDRNVTCVWLPKKNQESWRTY